jgi:hypothetical protein
MKSETASGRSPVSFLWSALSATLILFQATQPAWGIGVCRDTDCGQEGTGVPTDSQGNPRGSNAPRNSNTKAPLNCDAVRNQVNNLCGQYNSPGADKDKIREKIHALSQEWAGSACGNGNGLGCGDVGYGGGEPAGRPPGSSSSQGASSPGGGQAAGGFSGGGGTSSGAKSPPSATGSGPSTPPATAVLAPPDISGPSPPPGPPEETNTGGRQSILDVPSGKSRKESWGGGKAEETHPEQQ